MLTNEMSNEFAPKTTASKSAVSSSVPPTKEEALQLMYKIHRELSQMYAARVRLQFRIKRLEDITNRVKFIKRDKRDQLKFIGRLTGSRRELKATLADINSFETEFKNLESSLNS